MKKILYIGGFEMPDRNAAAHRVRILSKVFRDLGYEVVFYGIKRDASSPDFVDGSHNYSKSYPDGIKSWMSYALGGGIRDVIMYHKPDIVVAYNYPGIASLRLISLCKRKGIIVYGDITEWYDSTSIIKKLDVFIRMRIANKKLDGIVSISKLLDNYYRKYNSILVPPLVDVSDDKWKQRGGTYSEDDINIVYAGSPGGKGNLKDRLDLVLSAFASVGNKKMIMRIVGMTEEEYGQSFKSTIPDSIRVCFLGRLPHTETLSVLLQSDFQVFFRERSRANMAGFPTKLVESITCRVPVVTNDVSNVSDYVIDGYNGIIASDFSNESVINVFKRISIMSRQEINQMKANCQCDTFDYHSFIDVFKKFLNN